MCLRSSVKPCVIIIGASIAVASGQAAGLMDIMAVFRSLLSMRITKDGPKSPAVSTKGCPRASRGSILCSRFGRARIECLIALAFHHCTELSRNSWRCLLKHCCPRVLRLQRPGRVQTCAPSYGHAMLPQLHMFATALRWPLFAFDLHRLLGVSALPYLHHMFLVLGSFCRMSRCAVASFVRRTQIINVEGR